MESYDRIKADHEAELKKFQDKPTVEVYLHTQTRVMLELLFHMEQVKQELRAVNSGICAIRSKLGASI
jgi:hypothetical protein